jgi:hypothetical protein
MTVAATVYESNINSYLFDSSRDSRDRHWNYASCTDNRTKSCAVNCLPLPTVSYTHSSIIRLSSSSKDK